MFMDVIIHAASPATMGTPARIGTPKGTKSQQNSEKKKKKKMKVQQRGKVVFQFAKMLHLGKNYKNSQQ